MAALAVGENAEGERAAVPMLHALPPPGGWGGG
jgi:hypothetical protein